MIRIFFALLALVLSAVMLIFGRYISGKDKSPHGQSVMKLNLCAAATDITYAAALLVPGGIIARILYGAYFLASDWLMVYMLLYTVQYTNAYKKRRVMPLVIGFVTGIDGLLILAGSIMEWSVKFGVQTDISGADVYGVIGYTPLFIIHRVVIYILALLIFMTITHKIYTSPWLYRGRYNSILLAFVLIIAANVITTVMHLKYDISVLLYVVLGVGSIYFSVYNIPRGLIENLLSFAAYNMDDAVICYDTDGKCIFANENARRLFDAFVDETPFNTFYKTSTDSRNLGDKNEYTWNSSRLIAGVTRYYETSFKRLNDKKARYIGSLFMIKDETDDVQSLHEERYRNTHDMLTGIYNKNYFYKKAADALSTSPDGTYCMVVTDIKDFKLINDVFGVETGDMILTKSANALRELAGEGTVYGRLSGDRFAILMPRERFTAKLFEDQINSIATVEGTDNYHALIHVGVYNIENNEMEISVICDRAILAIKSIKSSYTEIVAFYDEKLRESRIGIQKITNEFAQALEEGQFCVFIQPQTSAADGTVLGGEALVRWKHPKRGMVPPAEFISIFESTGLISRLDKYVWELVCKQLKKWKDEGRDKYHISVNISPKDFYFTDIYETFTSLVEKYGIDPRNLRLEITETAIMTDVKKQIALIDKLRSFGFAVEMDDFGSGYSSLNTLKDICFDTLKIDMGFLRKTENMQRSKTILDNIILLSKQLGMEVITEGVETEEQISFLRDAGCDIFQGYYFAKPMPVSDFEEKYFSTGEAAGGSSHAEISANK